MHSVVVAETAVAVAVSANEKRLELKSELNAAARCCSGSGRDVVAVAVMIVAAVEVEYEEVAVGTSPATDETLDDEDGIAAVSLGVVVEDGTPLPRAGASTALSGFLLLGRSSDPAPERGPAEVRLPTLLVTMTTTTLSNAIRSATCLHSHRRRP